MDASLERKLRDILDRDEIWQVMQRYARGLDRVDRALIRSCYFDDAIEDHGRFVGTPDQFIDYADQMTLSFKKTHHGLLNHHCEVDGNDAYAETYYMFVGVAAEPPHFMSTGRYIDQFQRRNGEWRFANRITLVESYLAVNDWSDSAVGPSSYPDASAQLSTRDKADASYQRPLRPRPPQAPRIWDESGGVAI
jgi:hypothetical protein